VHVQRLHADSLDLHADRAALTAPGGRVARYLDALARACHLDRDLAGDACARRPAGEYPHLVAHARAIVDREGADHVPPRVGDDLRHCRDAVVAERHVHAGDLDERVVKRNILEMRERVDLRAAGIGPGLTLRALYALYALYALRALAALRVPLHERFIGTARAGGADEPRIAARVVARRDRGDRALRARQRAQQQDGQDRTRQHPSCTHELLLKERRPGPVDRERAGVWAPGDDCASFCSAKEKLFLPLSRRRVRSAAEARAERVCGEKRGKPQTRLSVRDVLQ
jgi:hypothetical protein